MPWTGMGAAPIRFEAPPTELLVPTADQYDDVTAWYASEVGPPSGAGLGAGPGPDPIDLVTRAEVFAPSVGAATV